MKSINFETELKDFWHSYHNGKWRNRPTVLRQPFQRPLLTDRELFEGVQIASAEKKLTLEIANFRVISDVGQLMPSPSDINLESYYKRISDKIEQKRFCLVGGNFNSYLNPEVSDRIRLFLNGFYSKKKQRLPESEAVLFMGNYEITPKGIHTDSADVFVFVTNGEKKIRLWPQKKFKTSPGAVSASDFSALKKDSILLEGSPGDILYWPSSYWHVADSGGELCGSLSIGVHEWQTHPNSFIKFCEKYPPEFKEESLVLSENIRSFKDAVNYSWLDELIFRFEMERTSNTGFETSTPALENQSLTKNDFISVKKEFPILFKKYKGQGCISANGFSAFIPHHQNIAKLVERLNQGNVESVMDLLKRYSNNGLSKGFISLLLEMLACWRGIHKAAKP